MGLLEENLKWLDLYPKSMNNVYLKNFLTSLSSV